MVSKNDPRVTKIEKFIRTFRDDFPNFSPVITGKMVLLVQDLKGLRLMNFIKKINIIPKIHFFVAGLSLLPLWIILGGQ